ncbi:ATP-dependent DNA ligase [Frigoribacterium sp. Leaf164]|uniref:DUF7882 family protein n=1 Tax=Frigoribacterium sp. Leaf164 TaxID=1736282 RepID=UPI000AB539FA|nr:ATP-dependent DNA ligase [Frigoribacterium sp. Leaf164]
MGTLRYDHGTVDIEMDDRTLAHVRLVVMAKLRRHESFPFTWEDSTGAGGGWNSIWIHPGASFHFAFLGGRSPRVNTLWVEQLMASANSAAGLVLTREPAGQPPLPPSDRPVAVTTRAGVVPTEVRAPRLRARGAVIREASPL